MKSEIFGLIGALLGTILGWILNTISRGGKLNIYVTSWKENFTFNKRGVMSPSTSIEESSNYDYELEMDIYNSSSDTKIMRNIKIVFRNQKEVLFVSTPYDSSTKRFVARHFSLDELKTINISPKTVATIRLERNLWLEDSKNDLIWFANNILLSYIDSKNKNKTIFVQKVDYRKYFE